VFRKWLKMVVIPILRFKHKNESLQPQSPS
jgi:hypothetical protein